MSTSFPHRSRWATLGTAIVAAALVAGIGFVAAEDDPAPPTVASTSDLKPRTYSVSGEPTVPNVATVDLSEVDTNLPSIPKIGPAGEPIRMVTTADGYRVWGYDTTEAFVPVA